MGQSQHGSRALTSRWCNPSLASLLLLAGLTAGAPLQAAPADCQSCQATVLGFAYTSEVWRNIHGGLQTGSAYLGKVDLMAMIDGGPLWGIPGLRIYAHEIYVNGQPVSGELVGDSQGVSNIEALRAWRLFESWVEWQSGPHSSVRFGLYDLNSEFDTIETAQVFLNASHGIGKDVSQSGRTGPSIFPLTSLALRFRWNNSEFWASEIAILDGVAGDPADPDAMAAVHISQRDGALLIAETSLQGTAVRRAALGAWHYTSRFDTIDSMECLPRASQSGNSGFYGTLEATIVGGEEAHRGSLAGFARAGYADTRVNRFGLFAGGGIVYTGLLAEADRVAMGVALASNGDAYRRAVRLVGYIEPRTETNIEATWSYPVNPWLVVQPDVQYIINPNTDPTLGDDLVVGLRFTLALSNSKEP
jgi:porin